MRAALLAVGLACLGVRESARPDPAPWLHVAQLELSTREASGPASNGRILDYHRSTSLGPARDEVPWCSSFVNWCLRQTRITGTGSARARSWLDWGEELCEPQPGSIVVLQGDTPWQGHVGFYLGSGEAEIVVLGGNQNDEVSIRAYPVGRVLGYRWPASPAAIRWR